MAKRKIIVYLVGDIGYFAIDAAKLEQYTSQFPGGHQEEVETDYDEESVRSALKEKGINVVGNLFESS